MPKVTVKIREDACKGCGLCAAACPKKIVSLHTHRLNGKGFHPAHVTDMAQCTGCASCAVMCPETIITIVK